MNTKLLPPTERCDNLMRELNGFLDLTHQQSSDGDFFNYTCLMQEMFREYIKSDSFKKLPADEQGDNINIFFKITDLITQCDTLGLAVPDELFNIHINLKENSK